MRQALSRWCRTFRQTSSRTTFWRWLTCPGFSNSLPFSPLSFEQGPNGPLVPELKAMFPDAPYIARPGQINAWDNEDFVKAIKATGRKQLIIAGVVTDVCVTFPTLSALAEGFEVFVVTDASGTFNTTVQQAAWSRMTQAGAQLMNWFSVACELQGDWRNDIEGLGNLLSERIPNYRNLMNSYSALTAR
ncbi:isochorismatase family protein [Pseudomonas coronafaciens]|uniref:isochorismatase family protein n=1 Tax=Pseudomonas coronafaciens TaxID=53409 RepID=UPI000F00E77F|nr:isochorismatase family protein [Pseudomonas coronafaciens]